MCVFELCVCVSVEHMLHRQPNDLVKQRPSFSLVFSKLSISVSLLFFFPESSVCMDCGQPETSWGGATYGILLCVQCAGRHRSLGTHITVIKSVREMVCAWI